MHEWTCGKHLPKQYWPPTDHWHCEDDVQAVRFVIEPQESATHLHWRQRTAAILCSNVLLLGKYWQRAFSVEHRAELNDGHGVVFGPHTDVQFTQAVPSNWHCGSAVQSAEIVYALQGVVTSAAVNGGIFSACLTDSDAHVIVHVVLAARRELVAHNLLVVVGAGWRERWRRSKLRSEWRRQTGIAADISVDVEHARRLAIVLRGKGRARERGP